MTTKEYKVKAKYQPGDKVCILIPPDHFISQVGDSCFILNTTIKDISIVIEHERDKNPRTSILYKVKDWKRNTSTHMEENIFPNSGFAILHANMMGLKVEREE